MIPRDELKVGLIVRLLNGRGNEHPVGVVREIPPDEGRFIVEYPDFGWDLSHALSRDSNLLEPRCPGLGLEAYERVSYDDLLAYIEKLRASKLNRLRNLIESSAKQIGWLAGRNAYWEKEVERILQGLDDPAQ